MSKDSLHIKKMLYRIAEDNDKEAFNVFFAHYHGKLIRFALLFVPHYDEAEDIVSNVLVRLLKNRKKAFLMDNFEGYLFISVKNEALNCLKKEKRFNKINVSEEEADFIDSRFIDPLEKILGEELRSVIFQAVESLSPKRKMVYKLIKDEEMSYKEVALLMGISERTVEVHIKYAMKMIRLVVSNYLENKQGTTGTGYLRVAKTLLLCVMGI